MRAFFKSRIAAKMFCSARSIVDKSVVRDASLLLAMTLRTAALWCSNSGLGKCFACSECGSSSAESMTSSSKEGCWMEKEECSDGDCNCNSKGFGKGLEFICVKVSKSCGVLNFVLGSKDFDVGLKLRGFCCEWGERIVQ